MAVAEDGNNQTVSNQDLLKKLDYSRNPIQGVGPWNFERGTSSSLWSANDKTGGIGFELQLREDTGMVNSTGKQYKEENHRGSVLYRAIRNNSTFTYGDLSGHYIHTETKYSGSLGVDAKGTGSFSITANVKQDPAIQTGISWQY